MSPGCWAVTFAAVALQEICLVALLAFATRLTLLLAQFLLSLSEACCASCCFVAKGPSC